MVPDKYKAVWVSHSSMGDFLKCPRAYYLHNIYKDPGTGHKVNIVNPPLALGQAVHEVLEGLANFKAEDRFKVPFSEIYDKAWKKVSGEKGGFRNKDEEEEVKKVGWTMIDRVVNNPGPLVNKTVKIKDGDNGTPPHYYISEEDNIILCGKIDWLEYVPEDDSVRLLDFKTGKNEENGDSLQLPIYNLLLNNLQKRKLSGAAYWYLFRDSAPVPVDLPSVQESYEKVLAVAKKVKETRESKKFDCPRGKEGCFACRPFELILKGEAKFVGVGEYNQDLYILS